VLARGFGDRTQQAVVGHSFGGYAALLAVTHHAQRFRFALAAAPPTDYGWTKAWQAAHDDGTIAASGRPAAIEFVQHGFRFDDPAWRARMTRESPLAGVEHLRVPLYLWAGAHDPRVPLKSVTHYAAAARGAGKPVTLLIDPDAGHVPATPLGTEAWLHLLEHAAARHFGTVATPASPELAEFLLRNGLSPASTSAGTHAGPASP
jgi:dipeptidyl aminopeptidase/acylaminoacyl peptidase